MSPVQRHPPRVDAPSLRAASPVIGSLEALPLDQRAAAVRDLWDGYDGPIVEPAPGDPTARLVTFLARDAHAFAVLVSINRITADLESATMTRLDGTGLWWACFRLDRAWRGSYGLLPVTGDAHAELTALDPRWAMRAVRERAEPDPRTVDRDRGHGGGWSSVACLPDAPAQPWLHRRPDVPRGTVTETSAPGGRRVWTYAPAHAAGDHPCIVLFDGEVWQASGHAATTVDNLVADGLIAAPYLVMIDQGPMPQRIADLSVDGSLGGWVADHLLGWVRATYPVSHLADRTVLVGQSLGGLTALKMALTRPDVIGVALAQSSSLWQDDLLGDIATSTTLRAELQVGTYEPVLLDAHRRLADGARTRGLEVGLTEYVGGHDQAWWRGGLADGLRRVIPLSGPRAG